MGLHYLDETHHLFGGRGNVWSKTAHIAKTNTYGTPEYGKTMCGKPMLSSNWVAIEGVKDVGCPECIKLYKKEQDEKDI